MTGYRKAHILTNENIQTIVQECVEAYKKIAKKRERDTVKLSLAIEEILISFQKCYGTEHHCLVTLHKSGDKVDFIFRQHAPQKNPIYVDDVDHFTQDILSRMGVAPKYTYEAKKNTNVVILNASLMPMKNKTIYEILGALALAIITYFLTTLFPESVQTMIAETFVGPIFNKVTAIIGAIATPLVFFAVVNGISDIGDVSSLGQIGKRYLKEVMLTYLIAGVTFTTLAVIGYGVATNAIGDSGSFIAQIVQLVLDIIPDNLLMPFTIDNDLQVVVIAIFVGVALILMQKKSATVKDAMALCGDVVNQMMSIAFHIVPLIVYLGVLNILLKKIENLGSLYILCIIFVASAAIVTGYVTIRACIVTKTPFKVLFKKQLPTTMINLTTSSQVSALPENLICCKEKFGIDEKLVDFGIPLGVVIYMPNGACFLGLVVWALAMIAGIPITIPQIVIIMLMGIIVAIAAPPIPGSALTVMPILMAICNIPGEYYPVAIIAGTLLGYFLPVLNGYCLQLQLLIIAKGLNMVNTETLHKPIE